MQSKAILGLVNNELKFYLEDTEIIDLTSHHCKAELERIATIEDYRFPTRLRRAAFSNNIHYNFKGKFFFFFSFFI